MQSRRSVVAFAAAALLLGACGTGGGGQGQAGQSSAPAGPKKVTFEFWNLATSEPGKSFWANTIAAYQKMHPNVTIKNVAIENDSYKPKLATTVQSGKAPDVYQHWGGGVLKQHVDAGLVRDLTADVGDLIPNLTTAALTAYQFDGKTWGLPADIGMVGFWYNKALFEKAGIQQPPATWTEFIDAVKKLKAAGVTPIALAGKAKWPGHYYWSYLAMRIAGVPGLQQAADNADFTGPDFVAASQRLKELADLQPFQKGFQGADYSTPDGQAATMGNGKAAMELMGQWAPSVQKDSSKKGLGDDLGFFTFPVVEGGKGAATDAFGGGGGFSLGKDAPQEALDFLKFALGPENHRKMVQVGAALPVYKGEEEAVADPLLKQVAQTVAQATAFQLYLDQAYPPAVGQQVNDSVAELINGTKTPQEVVQDITETAKSEME
ncbi:extracellular solute-binding protein [Thermoactinospora rubra]|uniref:extracellular solute-binding protein n=1 Tax=Thermoactinospora rubra TaxID=1088767 RepID=UPI000A1090DF|nr:extracellular solute-binding protein [Thermoactinospora rubra]